MLSLTKETDSEIVVTLNEKKTLDEGYWLFRFVHSETREVVSKIYSFDEDLSDYQSRYNKFELLATVFENKPSGFWDYFIYEQASSSNTDPDGLTEVERGLMKLNSDDPFAFRQYEQETSYKVYAGE